MSIDAWKRNYREQHPYCELAKYFTRVGNQILLPFQNVVAVRCWGRPAHIDATDLHHVIGKDARGRTYHESNVLHLCREVHSWVGDSLAGRVLCCVELNRKGVPDWAAHLSEFSLRNYPHILDTDPYIEACDEFPWLEALRVELLRKAA